MLARMLALAIRGIGKPNGRRIGATGRSIIAHVAPQAPLPRRSSARTEHRHRSIVAMNFVALEGVIRNSCHERIEQLARRTHPVSERRAIEIDPFSLINLALPVQWQMIAVLRYEDMGE